MKRSILVVGVLVAAMAVAAVQADDHVPFTDKDLESEESMWNLYERWRAVYVSSSSSSGDLADKISRFEVFKENARYVSESNKKEGMTYKLGLNQFSDMTMEEFTAKYTGARPGPRISSGSEPLPAVGDDCCVPESWDWRNYGAVTPVKDQGGCGSCWAFSVVGAVESTYKIKKGKLLTLSEQQVLDCSGAGDCEKGGYTYYAFDYAIKTGITLNASGNPPYYPPYEGKKDTCRFDPKKPPVVKITGKSFVPYGDEEALKVAVYHQPVSVLIEASNDFHSYSGGVFTGSCGTSLNHAVLVVGYGKVHHGPRYWIVKNSWGPKWGENGYIRMARNIDFEEGICGIATYAMFPTGIAASSPAATVATY